MMDWKTSTLGGLTTFMGRGKSPAYADEHDGDRMPVLNQACVQDGKLDLGRLKFITRKFWDSLPDERRLQRGDVLINSTGTGTLGRLGFWKGDLEAAFDGHITVLRFPEEHCSLFFYHLLNTDSCRSIIEGECTSGSTNQVELVREQLRRMVLKHPLHKDMQSTIAELLSLVDRGIEETEALLAKQQRIKTGLMHDLLTRGLDDKGRLRDPSTHQFKPSQYGPIPEDWDVSPASGLCEAVIDCKNRTPPSTLSGHPVIRTPNVRNGRFVYEDLAFTDNESYEVWVSRGKPRVGDVVITREAPYGEACQIPAEIPAACLGQRMMMYQPNPMKLRGDYLVYAIYSQAVQSRLLELAGGSTVGHIRVGDIRSLPLPHPRSTVEQGDICDALNSLSSIDTETMASLRKLTKLKAGLMRDLLTGCVSVTPLLTNSNGPNF